MTGGVQFRRGIQDLTVPDYSHSRFGKLVIAVDIHNIFDCPGWRLHWRALRFSFLQRTEEFRPGIIEVEHHSPAQITIQRADDPGFETFSLWFEIGHATHFIRTYSVNRALFVTAEIGFKKVRNLRNSRGK